MKAEFRIEDFSATHVGEVRSENEDSHAALADAKVWLVADGMGGHLNGKFASETIANAVAQTEFPQALEAACDAMAKVIHNANAKIYAKSIEMGAQIGSTFVSLLVRGKLERNVAIEAAVVAKDEFIEIGIDVLAAQSVIGARAPALH